MNANTSQVSTDSNKDDNDIEQSTSQMIKNFQSVPFTYATLVYEDNSNHFFNTFYSDQAKLTISESYTLTGCKNITEGNWVNSVKNIKMDYKLRGIPFTNFTLCLREYKLTQEEYMLT